MKDEDIILKLRRNFNLEDYNNKLLRTFLIIFLITFVLAIILLI